MNSFEQIVNELLAIEADISAYSARLEGERGEIINTMNKAQSVFGKQEAGQNLVTALYRALENLVNADSSLHLVKSDIHDYIQNIRK